jgi:hypothetical protein
MGQAMQTIKKMDAWRRNNFVAQLIATLMHLNTCENVDTEQ